MNMRHYGLDLTVTREPMGFVYGEGVSGPSPELRRLDDIRKSLKDPQCSGPETVYSIAMDVRKEEHRALLEQKMLLFGVVTYAAGKLGNEPVRSQGHIHAISPHCGCSTPEVYEIWEGKAIVYMQETAQDNPGRCFAVEAWAGDVVIVPPNWAHATVNADPTRPMTFGAWCDRQYGFEYADVRRHGGLAWFPEVEADGSISWHRNEAYEPSKLIVKAPEAYTQLQLDGTPIYRQFEQHPDRFDFVPYPDKVQSVWENFTP